MQGLHQRLAKTSAFIDTLFSGLLPPRAHDSCDKVLHCEVRKMPRPRGKLQGYLRVGSAHQD